MITPTVTEFCAWASDVLPGTSEEMLRKLREETGEFFDHPCGEEAADVIFVLARWCESEGIDLAAELDRKLAIVKTRTWVQQPDGTFHHIKSTLELGDP